MNPGYYCFAISLALDVFVKFAVFQNEVRIVTAGYYDEENNVLHVEPSHNTHAFKKILVAVLVSKILKTNDNSLLTLIL